MKFKEGDTAYTISPMNDFPLRCTVVQCISDGCYGAPQYEVRFPDDDKGRIQYECFMYPTFDDAKHQTITAVVAQISSLDSQICKLQNNRKRIRRNLKSIESMKEIPCPS